MARRTRIKICGVTRAADACLAAELGADAIGLVFVPRSRRFLSLERAREIARSLGGFERRVGLFMDPEAGAVERVLETVALDMLQFHGGEPETFCRRFGLPYLKAISAVQGLDDLDRRYPSAFALLIDSHAEGQLGGTGEAFDWSRFPGDSERRLILAGGLTPNNVGAAISATRPYAVDVSSGVESAPGIKDRGKLEAFFEQVRDADFG